MNRYDDIGATWLGGITTNNWSLQPTWTKLRNRHSIRTGYDLRVTHEDERLDGHPAGLYTFRENFTRQTENSTSFHGQDLAGLLLGLPTGGRIETLGDRFNAVIYHGVFVQDDVRLSNRLTVNLGLRYELEGAPTERLDRNVRGFDPDAPLSMTTAAEAAYAARPIPEIAPSAFRVLGGVRFTDDQHRGFWNADRNNLEPRLGLAYHLNSRTLLRGGWAIYTAPVVVDGVRQLGFTASTPLTPTLDNGRTFRATLANPFPSGKLSPPGQSAGADTQLGQNLDRFYDDVNFHNGQVMRWVTSIQRELPGRWLVEASYVGSRGYDLRTAVEKNAIPVQYLSRAETRDDATNGFLTSNVPNPFAGLMPGAGLNGATVQRQQLLRPFPQFTGLDGFAYDGRSRYSALQLRLDKRFSKGYSFLTTYTYARALESLTRLNDGDAFYEERPSRTDIPHRLVVNPIWELPFGRGRALGHDASGLANSLIGGWSIAVVYQWQSGEPLSVGDVYYAEDLGALKTSISASTIDNVFDTGGFYFHDELVQTNGIDDPAKQRADRRIQLASHYQTLASRTRSFRGSPLADWDMSLVKRLPIAGRVRAQFHLELYNATNFVCSGIRTSTRRARTSGESRARETCRATFSSPRRSPSDHAR